MSWKVQKWELLAQPSEYSAVNLARLCNVSSRQLQREFRRQKGCSPQKWLDEQRILSAQQLLLWGFPVKKVAMELGYKHSSHFCKKFKARRSMTPMEFTLRSFPNVKAGHVADG